MDQRLVHENASLDGFCAASECRRRSLAAAYRPECRASARAPASWQAARYPAGCGAGKAGERSSPNLPTERASREVIERCDSGVIRPARRPGADDERRAAGYSATNWPLGTLVEVMSTGSSVSPQAGLSASC